MHILLNNLIGFSVKAQDGIIGRVHDFYFDDETWTIRYLIVRTGSWFSGRFVLIPSSELGKPDWERHHFCVGLTCSQVRDSPDIDTEKPVYRQQEIALHDYYQWLPYWKVGMVDAFGPVSLPSSATGSEEDEKDEGSGQKALGDPHLRSIRHVRGYYIHAKDGNIGHIDECIVDDKNWSIESFVADTRNFFPGKKVILPVHEVTSVEWLDFSIHLSLSREFVRNSPEFNPAKLELLAVSKFWIALPAHTRHNSTCKHFQNTKMGYLTDEEEGEPCSLCGG